MIAALTRLLPVRRRLGLLVTLVDPGQHRGAPGERDQVLAQYRVGARNSAHAR